MKQIFSNCGCEYESEYKSKRKYCYECAYEIKKEKSRDYFKRLRIEKEEYGIQEREVDYTHRFNIDDMFNIQKLVKNRKVNKIKFKDICKMFPKINKSVLKKYCDRIIKSEKEKIYTEEI